MAALGATMPIAVRAGEGPLTEPTAATQLWRRQPLFMPQSTLSTAYQHPPYAAKV
jgi:hypothetical protein